MKTIHYLTSAKRNYKNKKTENGIQQHFDLTGTEDKVSLPQTKESLQYHEPIK